jgi:hypothetical protein
MRILSLNVRPPVALVAAATALVAGCGGGVEGRYVPRGDALFESLTLGAEGRVEIVFIGAPGLGTYTTDGNVVTLNREGEKALFVLDDGCLTNSILGTYCRAGNAPPSVGSAGAGNAAAAATGGAEIYQATTQEGRITLELLSGSQARLTMRPNAPGGDLPAQMSFDVSYEREGDGMLISLPGEDPMQLIRSGRDFVATMNGETARFVRQ